MADRILFIGWGAPVAGREARAVEVFNDALGICGRMQQEGRIEGFEVRLFEPNAELGGYIEMRGTAEQITAARDDDAFRRNTVDAQLAVTGMRHIEGVAENGVAEEMARYVAAVGAVPQMAQA
jgi:hypothetical protein